MKTDFGAFHNVLHCCNVLAIQCEIILNIAEADLLFALVLDIFLDGLQPYMQVDKKVKQSTCTAPCMVYKPL